MQAPSRIRCIAPRSGWLITTVSFAYSSSVLAPSNRKCMPSLVQLRTASAKNDSRSPCKHVCLQLIYARAFLKEVQIKNDQVRYLVQNARNGQCQGHRAELFAVRAARASAAVAVSWPACTAGLGGSSK